jgi:predicted dehydrogenase
LDRDALLADKTNEIYFDASVTAGRYERAARALNAHKHVYLEKPIAETLEQAIDLADMAEKLGLKNGTVQDKLFLPSLLKLRKLSESGYFGTILQAKIDFGWWVFDGTMHPAQRSSWNYRKQDGGGLVLDMFPHWRYIIETLLGEIKSVSCRTKTTTPKRIDEKGQAYDVDVEDLVLATFELANGALVEVNASWSSRIKRDDILTIQVDGTQGSALAGVYRCYIQPLVATPKPAWSIDTPTTENFDSQWLEVPDVGVYNNSYRAGWELFLKHVVENGSFASPLSAGVKGLQLVDACYRSNSERRWIDLS